MEVITINQAMEMKDSIFVDVRSPVEFEEDHISGAVNLAVLDNEERKIVGTLYKKDPKEATDLAYDYYHKKLSRVISEINKFDKSKKIVVYCFRGGLRSKTMAELIGDQGYETFQVEGGYKKYRAYLREELANFKPNFRFIVLHGLAGCGKTKLLKKLSPMLDLEGLAQHRSSIFGAIGLKPRKQRKFESLLLHELTMLKDEKFVFVEGESHKVGRVFIPNKVFEEMNKGIKVHIITPTEERVKIIVEDYFTHDKDEIIKDLISSLKVHLSNKVVEELIEAIDEKNYESVAKVLLLDYYDSRYKHLFDTFKFDYEVNNSNFVEAVNDLVRIKQELESNHN